MCLANKYTCPFLPTIFHVINRPRWAEVTRREPIHLCCTILVCTCSGTGVREGSGSNNREEGLEADTQQACLVNLTIWKSQTYVHLRRSPAKENSVKKSSKSREKKSPKTGLEEIRQLARPHNTLGLVRRIPLHPAVFGHPKAHPIYLWKK